MRLDAGALTSVSTVRKPGTESVNSASEFPLLDLAFESIYVFVKSCEHFWCLPFLVRGLQETASQT